MTLKIYVRDWGWQGASMVVTADPAVAYEKLIRPMIDYYHKIAVAHDEEAKKYPDEPNNNPWWRDFDEYVEKGLGLCEIYDVVEGLEFDTTGDN